ncbi:MAG: hypothetical protein JWQ11_3461 [Rhizobacter sp.]|nr:hypothetical protein [Rhizobacter sp.]
MTWIPGSRADASCRWQDVLPYEVAAMKPGANIWARFPSLRGSARPWFTGTLAELDAPRHGAPGHPAGMLFATAMIAPSGVCTQATLLKRSGLALSGTFRACT